MSIVFGNVLQLFGSIASFSCDEAGVVDQASAWHCCMVPWVATLATLVGISHSHAKRCKRTPKTTGHGGKVKRKPQTQNSDHKKTTGKPLWKVKRSISVQFGG